LVQFVLIILTQRALKKKPTHKIFNRIERSKV
jgi:hypothetical protein